MLKEENHLVIEDFDHHGIWCRLALSPCWTVNGYCKVPESKIYRLEVNNMGHPDNIDVHGGVTYGPDDDGWIGFDCIHFGDIWHNEEREKYYEEYGDEADDPSPPSRYDPGEIDKNRVDKDGHMALLEFPFVKAWTKSRVKKETKYLAQQVVLL